MVSVMELVIGGAITVLVLTQVLAAINLGATETALFGITTLIVAALVVARLAAAFRGT